MDSKIEKLDEMIKSNSRIVFFGGAGVSTESGIPDFRSADGIYMMNYKYPPEEIISRSFFDAHPKEFFEFTDSEPDKLFELRLAETYRSLGSDEKELLRRIIELLRRKG